VIKFIGGGLKYFAALGILSLVATLHAAPFIYNAEDLLVGFRKAGSPDYIVDLGPSSQFGNGNSFAITNYSASELTNVFTNLDGISFSFFGDVRTTTSSNPFNTLWLSRARTNVDTQTTPWSRQGSTAQGTVAGKMDGIGSGAVTYSGNIPPGSDNTTTAVAVTNNLYTSLVGAGGDFGGTFSQGSVETATPSGFTTNASSARSDLYRVQPLGIGTMPGTFLGYFDFRPDGSMSFTSVTNSSPPPETNGPSGPDCSHNGLVSAIAAGGVVSLSCSSISLTNTITIASTVTIDGGAGATLTSSGGTNGFGLFVVQPGANLTLLNLTFTGGRSTNGGALFIASGAQVTISNCVFLGNIAVGTNGTDGVSGSPNGTGRFGSNGRNARAGSAAFGGAIANRGQLAIFNSFFLTNRASGGSGGNGGDGGSGDLRAGHGGNGGRAAPAFGGAIWNAGSLLLTNSSFYGNVARGGNGGSGGAAGGGGFAGDGGDGASGAAGWGAAVYNSNMLTIVACTFATNVAQGGTGSKGASMDRIAKSGAGGGTAYGGAVCNAGPGAITNSTFFANLALGGTGGDGGDGGLKAGRGAGGGNATGGSLYSTRSLMVVNCSFSSGSAAGGTNGAAGNGPFTPNVSHRGRGLGGNIARGAGTFALMNSLLTSATSGGNGSGRIQDKGYNVSSDSSLPFRGTSRKKTSTDLESLLQDNGGPTQTLALETTNQNRLPPSAGYPPVDQRGTNRPYPGNAMASIGAYEFTPAGPAVISLRPQDQRVPQSSTVTLTAAARGQLPISFQWFFNNNLIYSTNYTTNSSGLGTTNLFPRITNSFVLTTNVSPFDAGLYTLVVSNALQTNPVSASANVSLAPLLVWGDTNFGLMNVPPQATNLAAISAGFGHMLALSSNGTVIAWGAGSTNAGTNSQFGQAIVPSGLANVAAVSAGGFHSLALKGDLTVVGWGAGATNSSGNNSQFGQANIPTGLSNVVEISAGEFHSLARIIDGTVTAWGAGGPGSSNNNSYGQATVPTNLDNVLDISAGGFHSLALSNFSVVAWGAGTNNSGANNQFGQSMVPTNLPGATAIAAGQFHSLALLSDGTVFGWGLNADGQATGTNSPAISSGLVTIGGAVLTNVAAIRAGYSNSLALLHDGTMVVWGNQPANPPGLTNGIGVAAGGNHLAFLLNNGSPFIIQQPFSAILKTNKTTLLTVGVVGAPPLAYQWYFVSTNNSGGTNQLLVLTNATSYSFTNSSSVPTNEAFVLITTNAFGSVTSRVANVTFNDGSPVFVLQPAASLTVVTGQTVTLTARAVGDPDPDYQWYQMAIVTNLINLTTNTNTFLLTGETDTTLTVPTQTQPTNEYFFAVASNSVNMTTSAVASVNFVARTINLPFAISSSQSLASDTKSEADQTSLKLAAPALSKSGFTFRFPTVPGVTYILEYKTSLSDTNWIPLLTNVGTGSPFTHTEPDVSHPSRFYRVRVR
jgi:alpha-tubulin suppressor-like RCC1 family protein